MGKPNQSQNDQNKLISNSSSRDNLIEEEEAKVEIPAKLEISAKKRSFISSDTVRYRDFEDLSSDTVTYRDFEDLSSDTVTYRDFEDLTETLGFKKDTLTFSLDDYKNLSKHDKNTFDACIEHLKNTHKLTLKTENPQISSIQANASLNYAKACLKKLNSNKAAAICVGLFAALATVAAVVFAWPVAITGALGFGLNIPYAAAIGSAAAAAGLGVASLGFANGFFHKSKFNDLKEITATLNKKCDDLTKPTAPGAGN